MNNHTQAYYLSRILKKPNHFLFFKWPLMVNQIFDDLKTHYDWLPKRTLVLMEKFKWPVWVLFYYHIDHYVWRQYSYYENMYMHCSSVKTFLIKKTVDKQCVVVDELLKISVHLKNPSNSSFILIDNLFSALKRGTLSIRFVVIDINTHLHRIVHDIFHIILSIHQASYTWDTIDWIKSRRYYILAMVTKSIQTDCCQRCVQTCNWISIFILLQMKQIPSKNAH